MEFRTLVGSDTMLMGVAHDFMILLAALARRIFHYDWGGI